MKKVRKKLNSSRGASSVIALIFFLVAMMVGAVCLTAAGTNAGRASHTLKDQQNYYAVESALKLLGGELEKNTVAVKKLSTASDPTTEIPDNAFLLKLFEENIKDRIIGKYLTPEDAEETDPLGGGTSLPEPVTKKAVLSEKLKEHGIPDVTAEITLKFSNEADISEFLTEEPVDDLTFEIKLYTGSTGKQSQTVLLRYAPVLKQSREYKYLENNRDIESYTDTVSLTWYQQSVERVSGENTGGEEPEVIG